MPESRNNRFLRLWRPLARGGYAVAHRLRWSDWAAIALALLILTLMTLLPAREPPPRTADLCAILEHQPRWYDYARASERRWGTPIAVQMAFIRQESSFRHDARPPRTRLWGLIPRSRPSSAYGYGQIQDPVWGEYLAEEGSLLARRTHMKYALDFVGWYNHRTHEQLGIEKDDARRLYIAYHRGRTGYRRGDWRDQPWIVAGAERVARTAARYEAQLAECELRFRCRRFWQVGPLCR